MSAKIRLEVITPERLVLQEEVDFVTLPAYDGEMGVLPGHTHLLAQLHAGALRMMKNSEASFFAVSGGLAEVHPDRVHQSPPTEKLAANARYTALNAAYQCLREPRERLRHLLELELGRKPSDLTTVPDELMDLFFVVGTQNPLDFAGTYPLPLVQLDRFMFKIPMSYVDRETEISSLQDHSQIIEKSEHIQPG